MSTKTAPTNSDLSTHVGKFVRFAAGTRKLELNTAAGTACLGVLTKVYTLGVVQYGEYTNGGEQTSGVLMAKTLAAGTRITNDGSALATDIATTEVANGVMALAGTIGTIGQAQLFDTSTGTGGGAFASQGTLTASITDGATLTAAAAASMLPAANVITLPANFFPQVTVGDVPHGLIIRASGRISTVITTPGTARYDVRMGAVVVFDGLAILPDTVAAHVTVGWSLEIRLFLRAVGAVTQFFGIGVWTCEDILGVPATAPKGVLAAVLPWNTTPAVGTAYDGTIANTVDVFFTQTAATGSMTCHTYSLEAF